MVFNDGLRAQQEARAAGQPYISDGELSARLTASKATPGRVWLGEVSAVVLQQSLADLNTAYRNFFASVTGTRNGPKIEPPRLKSRKEKGSRNRDKARVQVAQAHAQVADARREPHHQLSTTLIRDNQAVAVEDLAVKGLARTGMAKSVHDAGWSAFVAMLEYKARLYGREFHRIGRFIPTSQTCSACGVKDGGSVQDVIDGGLLAGRTEVLGRAMPNPGEELTSPGYAGSGRLAVMQRRVGKLREAGLGMDSMTRWRRSARKFPERNDARRTGQYAGCLAADRVGRRWPYG